METLKKEAELLKQIDIEFIQENQGKNWRRFYLQHQREKPTLENILILKNHFNKIK